MKKIVLLISSLILCFLLTSCDPGSYRYDYNDLTSNITCVELINYENPEQEKFISWVPDHSSKLVPFNTSNLTVLEKLDNSKMADFLKKLSQYEILSDYYVFDSPKGICLKLSYTNGDFLIISCDYEEKSFGGYIGKYSLDGEVVEFIGSFSSYSYFESLVNDFFEVNI